MSTIKLPLLFIVIGTFSTQTSAQIKVLSNGNVGIHTSNPTVSFEILCDEVKYISDECPTASELIFRVSDIYVMGNELYSTDYSTLGNPNYPWYEIYYETLQQISDERLKSNIEDLTGGLEQIMKIRPIKYDMSDEYFSKLKNNKSNNKLIKQSKNKMGFSAQHTQTIFPELIRHDSLNDIYTFNYVGMIPAIVSAIQEQQDIIDNQNTKIEELENALTQLQKQINSNNTQKSIDIFEENNNTENESILYQNAPNPFGSSTQIRYFLPKTIHTAQMCIYSLNGIQIKCINLSKRGDSSITISGFDLNPGMYIYTLLANNQEIDSKRMIITN